MTRSREGSKILRVSRGCGYINISNYCVADAMASSEKPAWDHLGRLRARVSLLPFYRFDGEFDRPDRDEEATVFRDTVLHEIVE